MHNIMQYNDGLILGIEIQNKSSQISIYNSKQNELESVSDDSGNYIIMNPKEICILLSNADVVECNDYNLDLFCEYLSVLIKYALKSASIENIMHMCICLQKNTKPLMNLIKESMQRLCYSEDKYSVISRHEAFVYFTYSQKKELYSQGAMLCDLNEKGLNIYILNAQSKNRNVVISEVYKEIRLKELMDCGRGDISIEKVCDPLCMLISKQLENKRVSAVYLTGEGFNGGKIPDKFVKVICNRRKAFMGMNLYVKGACIYAKEQVLRENFSNVILQCPDSIRYAVETQIMDRGKIKRMRLSRLGTSWFNAHRKLSFILNDEKSIPIFIVGINGDVCKEFIDISEIPVRPEKTTQINLSIEYISTKKCVITIEDMGFGDFFAASGKNFTFEIDFERYLRERSD